MDNLKEEILTLRDASKICGYKPRTLKQMVYDVKLSLLKTKVGHYRMPLSLAIKLSGRKMPLENDGAFIYARVSSSENVSNLESQAKRLKEFAICNGYIVKEIFKETASGINDKRIKLFNMFQKVISERPEVIIVEHKDRLARLGFEYIRYFCEYFGCKILVVNEAETHKEDLMQDIMV